VIGLSLYFRNTSVAEIPLIQPPLSARGAAIVDATGREVMLRGVNWFGMETDTRSPHGLWARDYKAMLTQMRDLGYNVIRLPYSVQSLQASTVSGIDFTIGSNRDFEGMTPLQVMDRVIQEAEQNGLMVLLDSHRLNDQRIPELWYGDGFTEEDWINTWTMLATRYREQANVIGADLKNEPHGQASWGTGDRATDWRLAAERAGEAILKIAPDWLIVVEGVEKNVPGQVLDIHWWGGNLEGVRNYPVRLSRRDKLVYSPHEYGSGVFDQPWLQDRTFPRNLYRRWEIGFQYIARLKIAPVWVGEFGGRKIGRWSREGVWQRQFIEYLDENNLGFAYWSWNPNSDNTGGILNDDWRSVDGRKQRYLGALLTRSGFVIANASRINTTAVPPVSAIAQSPSEPQPSPLEQPPSISKEQRPSPRSALTLPAPSPSAAPEASVASPSPDSDDAAIAPSPNPEGTAIAPTPSPSPETPAPASSPSPTDQATKPLNPAPVPPTPAASSAEPSPLANSQPNPIEQPIVSRNLQLRTAQIESDWQEGFCFRAQIVNRGRSQSSPWRLTFRMEDAIIDSSWGGLFDRDGDYYTVEPYDWGRSLYPDQTLDLGFCAKKRGSNYQPEDVGLEVE
jgi:endoglucanase